jgi:hypothetical protein
MDMHCITAAKMLDEAAGRIGGYLVVWGSPYERDLQGEYFTPHTELGLAWYDRRPVLYQHGLDGSLKAAVMGYIDTLRADNVGIWAEAQLDVRQRYVRTVLTLIDRGVLHWSSGSLAHLVEVANDGHIQRWPIVEGSLTPTPAEPRRTDVQTIKSAYAALGLTPPLTPPRAHLATAHLQGGEIAPNDFHSMEGNGTMDEITITPTTPGHKRLPVAEQNDALKSARITVGSEFDALNAVDLLHGYVLLRAAKHFTGVSERYANALAHKVTKAGLIGIKDNELAYSTQTGYGDEWVPDLWSAQIWHKARTDNVILPLFQAIEMPSTLKRHS